MSRLPRSLAPLFVLFTLLSLPDPAGAAPRGGGGAPPVFEVISDGSEARTAEDAGASWVALLRVDQGLIQRDPDAVTVPLPGGGTAVARRSWWSWVSADEYHWFGELDGAAGSVAFHYYDGRLIGSLRTAEGEHRIEPEDSLHRLVRSESPFGSCGVGVSDEHAGHGEDGLGVIGEPVRSTSAAASSDTDCWVPMSNVNISVMVLYPQTLKSSAQAVTDYAVSRVAEASSLFALSNVKITYSLAYVGPITGAQPPGPYTSGGAEATQPALDWLNAQFATPAIDTEVEMLRRAYGADMIAVVVPAHPNGNCGIANLVEKRNGVETMYNSTQPFGTRAFHAVELNCGNADFTFAHELGHNYGMRHDPNPSSPRTSVNILDWAYGYILPLNPAQATVMGCAASGTSCSRIPRFSNPDLVYSGVAIGQHTSQAPNAAAHNACVANTRAAQYAAFASPPPTSPPSLTVTSPAEGAVVQPGVAFNLVASASDEQDGNLASQVQWTSNRDGFLGSGSPRSVTLFTKGPHLITATVTDSSGTTMPYSIRITVQDNDAPLRWIDYPSHNQVISGNFQVQGWATDASGVSSVSFKVDGAPVTLSGFVYGTSRPDVCAVYSSLKDPNCPNVGFIGTLATGSLSNGTHTLTVTVTDPYGNTGTFNRTFRKGVLATFGPTADAWTSEAQPTSNFGSDPSLQMRASGSGQAKHAYMKFSVSGITRPVMSAKLRVRTQTVAFSWYSLYWINDTTWQESTINWNNGPLAHSLFLSLGAQPANSWIELDVTSIVSGNGTYTFGMVGPDVNGLAIYSKEAHWTQQPSLLVYY